MSGLLRQVLDDLVASGIGERGGAAVNRVARGVALAEQLGLDAETGASVALEQHSIQETENTLRALAREIRRHR